MNIGFRQFCVGLIFVFEWSSLGLLGGLGFALDIALPKPGDDPIFLQLLVTWAQEWPTQIGVTLTFLVVLTRTLRWFLKTKTPEQKIIDRQITEALDKFRKVCFGNIPNNEPEDHNRVTLFKHVQWKWWVWPFKSVLSPWGLWRWPWSGWLVVTHRSGHVTQSATAIFLAPDDAPHSEGISGQAWRRGAYRVGKGDAKLPNLNGVDYVRFLWRCLLTLRRWLGSTNPTVVEFEEVSKRVKEYAKATTTTRRSVWQRIKKKKVCPTSLLAVPIHDRNNERWGVIVMDSCNSHECVDTDSPAFRKNLKLLTKTLHDCGITK